MIDLDAQRRFYAEEMEVVANLRTPALVDALATIPREQFLAPGPWTFRSEMDFMGGGPRRTPDADPRRLYHNIVVAIDLERQLYNGAPGILGACIDALGITPGAHVLHVGCGLGYYTAILAHLTGPAGRVVAIDVDEALATGARRNLAAWPWIEVRHGDGTGAGDARFDAILVNAGVTHPHDSWLAALESGGRLILPLTCSFPQMGPIGKGFFVLFTDRGEPERLDARVAGMVAIYSAVGLRDAALNERLGKAFLRSPFPPIKHLRRDAHEEGPACWLHGGSFCLSTA